MSLGLFKPEYLYRPSQLARRIFRSKPSGFATVRLPWGSGITVSTDDNVGSQIATLGLYDLVVTETLWRLCEAGEAALDIGANIGYTAFVISHRLGTGTLDCYEPHPVIFEELKKNIDSLRLSNCKATVNIHRLGLGPQVGELPLFIPEDFRYHRGESSLAMPSHLKCDQQTVSVPVDTLDRQVASKGDIGVVKMDVEGFEIEVLRGAETTFSKKQVRDCVFEEHNSYPTPVTTWFESHGYQVFRLDRSFSGVRLLDPGSSLPRTRWTASNFVATSDAVRLKKLLAPSGWNCLRNR
jgi:FkbM family methyltransferase